MISVRNLSFEYPAVWALRGVTLDIPAARITALVGPNGAGKTTLLRCLAALEQPHDGAITLDGIDVLAQPRRARARLGFLQDLFGLYDRLSVRQCLIHAASSHDVPRAEIAGRIDWAVGELGLRNLLDRAAGELSRGQRQRLGIGQALIHKPAVLILDEPASGLDPEARIELAATLRALCTQGGMTILVSSHILAELADYATHLVILDRGGVVSAGPLGTASAGIVEIELRLVGPADAAAALAAESAVTALRIAGPVVRFMFRGDEAAQATLLANLVTKGLKIASFAPATLDLQREYLARVRETRRAAP